MKRHVDPLRLCLNVALNTDTLNGLFYRNLLLQKCINLEGAFSGDSKKKKQPASRSHTQPARPSSVSAAIKNVSFDLVTILQPSGLHKEKALDYGEVQIGKPNWVNF